MELNKTFIDGLWSKEINVTSFVQTNITPYVGDASFLQGPTDRTKHIWNLCLKALEEERANNGVRSLDNKTVSTITSHKAADRPAAQARHQALRRHQRRIARLQGERRRRGREG